MRNIVNFISSSQLREHALHDAQKSRAPLSLILSNATRWCSEYDMLRRFLDLEGPLREVAPLWAAELVGSPMPDDTGFARLRALAKILADFANFTREVEGDHLCLPKVAPGLHRLLEKLKNTATNVEVGQSVAFFATRAVAALKHHLGDLLTVPNPALYAAALHPTHGHLRFVDAAVREAVWRKLIEIDERINPEPTTSQAIFTSDGNARADLLRRWRLHVETKSAKEDLDLLHFWKVEAGEAAKPLWPLVQRILCIPASSASAERAFSCLKFLNDSGGHTQIGTLQQLATIREEVVSNTYSFNALVALLAESEKRSSK